jgi:3',5'-cyclic AMP phosphodiesterase CpdA
MANAGRGLLSRRQALISLGAAAAGTLIRPVAVCGIAPVRNTLRFAVIGDWGTGNDDCSGIPTQMAAAHRTRPFEFVLTAGDNIYPDGSGRHFVKKFEQPYSALIRERLKFYAALGNHDVADGRSDQCQYPHFNMGGRCYYKLSKGDGLADIFMLDTTDFNAEQMGWFESELRASRARWKLAVFHHPLYSSGRTHGSSLKLRKQIEPLLVRYGVRAVFSGHDHIYERVTPQQGVQHFVTGAGGKVRRGNVNLRSPFRAASYDLDNHFMQIELDDHEIRFQALCETGKIIDSGTIF